MQPVTATFWTPARFPQLRVTPPSETDRSDTRLPHFGHRLVDSGHSTPSRWSVLVRNGSGVVFSLCERGSGLPSETDGATTKPFWTPRPRRTALHQSHFGQSPYTFWTYVEHNVFQFYNHFGHHFPIPHSRETAPSETDGTTPKPFWTPVPHILDTR